MEGHNTLTQFSKPTRYLRRPHGRNTDAELDPFTRVTRWSWNAIAKYLGQILLVVLAYWVAGKLGQATANIRSGNLGPVWPAYGVALAALLLYGYRVWPGIAASAFLVAFLSPVPALAAVGQAAGATIAALAGALLLHQIADFNPSLPRLRDALGLIVLGAFGSATLSASIGVSALYANHLRAYYGLGPAWLIYWLGDSTGVLLVTPLVFALAKSPQNSISIQDRGIRRSSRVSNGSMPHRLWGFAVCLHQAAHLSLFRTPVCNLGGHCLWSWWRHCLHFPHCCHRYD